MGLPLSQLTSLMNSTPFLFRIDFRPRYILYRRRRRRNKEISPGIDRAWQKEEIETMRKFSYVNYVNYARSEIDFLNIIPPFRNLYVSCEKLSNLICCTRRRVKWTESLTRQTYLNDLRFNIVIRSIRGSFETVYAPSDFLKSFKCQTTRTTTDKCPIKRW